MNPVAVLLKFFRKKTSQPSKTEQIAQRLREGFDAFQKGKAFYFKKRMQEPLDCFDEAIDCGHVDDEDEYAMRGRLPSDASKQCRR